MHAFDVLGDPVRRRLLELLADGERTSGGLVDAIQAELDISQPGVSQHLRVLRDSGFVAVRRDGVPAGDVQAFVHGNAEMIRRLRRYLFHELDFNRRRISMSGYWRSGQTEDGWQAGKREFNASLEAEDVVAA